MANLPSHPQHRPALQGPKLKPHRKANVVKSGLCRPPSPAPPWQAFYPLLTHPLRANANRKMCVMYVFLLRLSCSHTKGSAPEALIFAAAAAAAGSLKGLSWDHPQQCMQVAPPLSQLHGVPPPRAWPPMSLHKWPVHMIILITGKNFFGDHFIPGDKGPEKVIRCVSCTTGLTSLLS